MITPEPLYITTHQGKKTRVLTPLEYDQLTSRMKNIRLKTIWETLFYTGMRYVELQRLHAHPEWVQTGRGIIHLPLDAQKKKDRRMLERSIPIAPQIQNILPYFFKNNPPPSLQGWDQWVKRTAYKAGFEDAYGFSAKTTRKTIESWMLVAELPWNSVCLRQGHSHLTSLRHYQGLAFTGSEVAEIRKRLAGWW